MAQTARRIIVMPFYKANTVLYTWSFKRPLKSSVRGIFPHHAVVPTKDIIPTLLYAGTQNNTLEFLIMIHTSRGQPNEAGNGHSDFARRYHANTGPKSKLDAVAMLGYIPLKVDDMCVTEEVQRQEKANMRLCDCSNCQPEAAEALWLAQPAMTVNNFDDALAMGETELLQLVEDLPEAPLTDPAEIRHVAQVCHTDDPIEAIPLLETLVSYLDRAFHDFFYQIFTDASDLGPPDYFPRELAWNIAKNIDIITKPSDLALVLSSETILGQFDCLFVAFCQWKNAYPTAVLIADAAKRREVSYRANKSNKAPQSCEGAQIAKERADLAKAASKLATASAKEAEKAAKDAQKAAKDAHKAAKEQERSMKDAAMALCHATQHGLPIPPSTTSKRHAEGILEGEPCKFKGKAQGWPGRLSCDQLQTGLAALAFLTVGPGIFEEAFHCQNMFY
ncbi:uncharacterized protein MELLADRAFT_114353 [Melampsora larici-populina 98AG31]|uniref:Uncharacterized protein n=1 Tax=Melampsora larici-populina (strain 98AG31 / pathotype 3-4-7) TaxID=747676 RepID=F4SD56_MELLP|nr:uncharacterized protein MELLADRAFT_114353 [Melampsora larici-populina 98AG31]EGF97425.1 hypothetical protein MELLADRAFT_114353 [Melampsora larici-populina 98AG31]